jgi:DNA-binding MurR/RpiR family transcriptional regulator
MEDDRMRVGVGLAEEIRQRLKNLSPAERRVARILISGPPTVGLESSARLARRAGVSGPTVSRFVARLGYGSYADFQRVLHDELNARVISPLELYKRHHDGESPDTFLARSAEAFSNAIRLTVENLNVTDFNRATELLATERHQLIVMGGLYTHLLAACFVTALREIRPQVRLVAPTSSERAVAVADATRRDVAVVFDFRRYESETLEAAGALRRLGAPVILFTDPWLSPIATVADAVLVAQVNVSSPFDSLTPALAVVEMLVASVSDRLGDHGRGRFEKLAGLAAHWVSFWPDPAEQ